MSGPARRLRVPGGTGGALAGTAVVALAVRLAWVRALGGAPEFLVPVLDAAAHVEWARGLLAGTWPGAEAFVRAPGYVGALAGALAALGDDPARVARAQVLLGTVGPVLVAGLAGRLGGAAAAWIAGLGAAVYPTFLFFDGQLLAPALGVPLATGAAWLSVEAIRRRDARWAAVAGFAWGLAGVTRPPLLLAGVLLPALLARPARAAAVAALVALLLAPGAVTLRNLSASGEAVPIASTGGLNLWLGNGPEADGMAATLPEAPTALGYGMIAASREIASEAAGRPLGAGEASGWWTRRTLGAIADDPGRWGALLARKAALVVLDREIPNNHDPAAFAERWPILRGLPGWGAWFALGVVGAVLRRRDPAARLLALAALAVMAGCVLFFVNARFRVPAAPLWIALGGVAAADLASRLRSAPRRAVAPLVAVLVVAAAARANPLGISREPWPTSWVLLGEAELARGEPVRALRRIDRALEERPGLYPAVVARIDLLRRMHRFDEALAEATRAVAALPGDPRLRTERAALLDLRGDPAAALVELDVVLALDPGWAPARVNRAIVLDRLGRRDEAVATLRTFLAERPASPEADRARALLDELAAPRRPEDSP